MTVDEMLNVIAAVDTIVRKHAAEAASDGRVACSCRLCFAVFAIAHSDADSGFPRGYTGRHRIGDGTPEDDSSCHARQQWSEPSLQVTQDRST